jgi:hypothetical protein
MPYIGTCKQTGTGIPHGTSRSATWTLVLGSLLLVAAAPLVAQRGGAHAASGASRGGFSSSHLSGPRGGAGFGASGGFRGGGTQSAFPPRSPYTAGARPGFGQRFAPGAAFRSRPGAYVPRPYAPSARPNFYSRTPSGYRGGYPGGNRYLNRDRGNRFGFGFGYPAVFGTSLVFDPFLFDPLWDYGDPFWNSDADWGNAANQGFIDAGAYPQPQQPLAADNAQMTTDTRSNDPYAPGPETEPGPWAPGRSAYSAGGSTPRQETLVTIVYKDGRPPERIRNYALTRSALLLTGPQMREIPLDEIDLVATERVNRTAGVDFRPPQSE